MEISIFLEVSADKGGFEVLKLTLETDTFGKVFFF